MGYMRHHAILVTASQDSGRINTAHAKAVEICGELVSPIIKSAINCYGSFFVAPDGSKEGWANSNNGDIRRDAFVEWLNRQRWSDGSTSYSWAEVQYGDDEGESIITRHSDEITPSDNYSGPAELEER